MKSDMAMPAPTPGKEKDSTPEKYEIESAADTLTRAEEIKKDKRLMPHVKKHLAKKVKAISSIAELRDHAKSMQDDGDEDDAA